MPHRRMDGLPSVRDRVQETLSGHRNELVSLFSRYVAKGKGILQHHHLIDEFDSVVGEDGVMQELKDGPFSQILNSAQRMMYPEKRKGDQRREREMTPEVGKHSFFSEASGSKRDLQVDSFLSNQFGTRGEHVKQEGQTQFLRSFFNEWPKTRDTWSGLEDERSNQSSISTTQLSISIPMASSNFSTTSSRSLYG